MNNIIITLDIDWAPDFVIDTVAETLIQSQVKATWFVTHHSPAIDRLKQHKKLFELGIHPNFLPHSTQGKTPTEVLDYCMDLVPDAMSMRTHALVQSSPLFIEIMAQTPIKRDVSLFLPRCSWIQPFEYRLHGRSLWRIPYFWEDDFEMEAITPSWEITSLIKNDKGLKIFNFHPIHIYLNSKNIASYQKLKQHVPKLFESTPENTRKFINTTAPGSGQMYATLIKYIAIKKNSMCIRDIHLNTMSLSSE